jgi:glycosyltransferase involved in cell wall biosynthesis
MKNMTCTYVEFGIDGHQLSYIRSVIRAFRQFSSSWQLNIWLPNNLSDKQKDYLTCFNKSKPDSGQIQFKCYDELTFSALQKKKSVLSRISIIRRCIERDRASVCFIALNLDACLKEIAFSINLKIQCKLIGILGRPFLHYIGFSSAKAKKWFTMRQYFSHYLKTFLMVHRTTMAEVFVLDPLAAPYYNRYCFTSKFKYLPEYLDDTIPMTHARTRLKLPKDRVLYLFPGNIALRKGILEFLQALYKAAEGSRDFRRQAAVIISGPVMAEVHDMVYSSVGEIRSAFPNFPVFLIDRFLTDREFVSFFSAADVVCMPYKEFVGSSGILIHAAAFGRPVLASDFGLVGELVKRHGLGVACDWTNQAAAVNAFYRSFNEAKGISQEDFASAREFATKHSISIDQFGELICTSLVRVASKSK